MLTLSPTCSRIEQAAIAYAERGIRVLPTHDKRPHIKGGWAAATTDVDTIRRWWRKFPTANVGIACRSNGILVLDVDERHGGDDTLAELERIHGTLPDTPRALSGNGYHLFFQHPGVDVVGSYKGIDTRDRHFVDAPPSVHPVTGYVREWEFDLDEVDFAPMPEWLLTILAKVSKPVTGDRDSKPAAVAPFVAGAIEPGYEWWRDREAVERVLPVLGINEDIGKSFRCVIPGHDNPSGRGASIVVPSFVYVDFHNGNRTCSLAEVFASQIAGRPLELKDATRAMWSTRLLHQAGLIELELDKLAEVSNRGGIPLLLSTLGAKEQGPRNKGPGRNAQAVLDGFLLALAIRRWHDPSALGVTFTNTFGPDWCGLSEATWRRTWMELRTADVVRYVDEVPTATFPAKVFTLSDGTRPSSSKLDPDKYVTRETA